jgi:DNA-binding response OmpR family regulator
LTVTRKQVLVVSRHPHLSDVRKKVLEQAGYGVVSICEPESLEEACKNHKISMVLVGFSLTPAEKRRVVAEAMAFCSCPILELWDREPPRVRIDHRIFDHYSLTPEDFLDTVNTILGGTRPK